MYKSYIHTCCQVLSVNQTGSDSMGQKEKATRSQV